MISVTTAMTIGFLSPLNQFMLWILHGIAFLSITWSIQYWLFGIRDLLERLIQGQSSYLLENDFYSSVILFFNLYVSFGSGLTILLFKSSIY